MAHYFLYDVELRLLADSRSFLANQKARNAIVGAENLLNNNSSRPQAGEEVMEAIQSRDLSRKKILTTNIFVFYLLLL